MILKKRVTAGDRSGLLYLIEIIRFREWHKLANLIAATENLRVSRKPFHLTSI